MFSSPMVTNKESYWADWLGINGVKMYQDTDTRATMLRPPTQYWRERGLDNPNPDSKEHHDMMEGLATRMKELVEAEGASVVIQ